MQPRDSRRLPPLERVGVDNRVIRFADRRAAYGFVAELRRLYDLERWAELWVYVTGDGVLVDIPVREAAIDPLTSLARRYGGWAPGGEADLDGLRAAVTAAESHRREARNQMNLAQLNVDRATAEIRRSRHMPAGPPPPSPRAHKPPPGP
jgi:hypothetical protein